VKIGADAGTGSVITMMLLSRRKPVLVGLEFPIGRISGWQVIFPQGGCEPV
jgi:hypothetical protein